MITEVPYEVLIRYERGEYKGAHAGYLYCEFDADGNYVKDIGSGRVEPLAVAANDPRFKLADVLGQVVVDQQAVITVLEADKAGLAAQVEALQADKLNLEADKANLTAERDALLAEKEALQVEKDAIAAQVAELQPPAEG